MYANMMPVIFVIFTNANITVPKNTRHPPRKVFVEMHCAEMLDCELKFRVDDYKSNVYISSSNIEPHTYLYVKLHVHDTNAKLLDARSHLF